MSIPRSRMRDLSLLALSSLTSLTLANPILPHDSSAPPPIENGLIRPRCAYPCGWTGLCCESAGACYTDSNNQAQCGAGGSGGGIQQNVAAGGGGGGQYQLFTTTYTVTNDYLVTSTGSYLLGGAGVATQTPQVAVQSTAAGVSCDTSLGESPCGGICCASGQFCQFQGQCAASSGQHGDVSSDFLNSVTAVVAPLPSGTPALRPTSNVVATVTSTGTPTFTTAFSTPMPTSGAAGSGMNSTTTNNGLSGGAIAGIVIGVLLGLLLLLLICGCLCFKGLLDSVLAFFGLGPRRRRRQTDVYEEEYYEGTRPPPRRWFGTGPARPKRKEKKSGRLGGATAVAGGLATLAVLLGLKRRRDRKADKSSYTGSSYTGSSYYTSESKSSSSSSI